MDPCNLYIASMAMRAGQTAGCVDLFEEKDVARPLNLNDQSILKRLFGGVNEIRLLDF